MSIVSYDKFRAYVAIDGDDLDTSLMEQPEMYHHVSEQHIFAVATRDHLKLELDELTAELDQEIRQQAAEDDEKLTEGAISNRLKLKPDVKKLTREYLVAKGEAEKWGALKESFSKRSDALKSLVSLRIGERRDLALESGAGQTRNTYVADLAERNRQAAAELRRNRRNKG